MSTITCADFAARPADQMANIMFWLEGYYTEDDDPTTIDFAEFKSTLEKLLVYCGNNPTVGFLTAADEIIDDGELGLSSRHFPGPPLAFPPYGMI